MLKLKTDTPEYKFFAHNVKPEKIEELSGWVCLKKIYDGENCPVLHVKREDSVTGRELHCFFQPEDFEGDAVDQASELEDFAQQNAASLLSEGRP